MKQEEYQGKFGDYDVAVASYGNDVFKIFADETPRAHILLVDPKGHDQDKGNQVSKFLDKQIKEGKFGYSENPATELSNLSRLALEEKCPDFAAGYVQIPKSNEILIATAAFPFPLKFKGKNKLIHKVSSMWGDYLPGYHNHHSSAYKIKMIPGDILILSTDGVWENMETALGCNKRLLDGVRDQEKEEIAKQDAEHLGGKVKDQHTYIIKRRDELLYNFFKNNSYKSASQILETFIKTVGPMVIPKTDDDDDATICILKKN